MEKLYKFLKVLILVLAFAVVLVGAYVLYNNLSGEVKLASLAVETTEETGAASRVEDFTVYDIDGNAFKLSDFRGKPVILNFWASWCGPCAYEMPDFQTFYENYGEQIQFVMVNLTDGSQETVESASAFLAEQGYTFPVFYDTDKDAAYAYNVYSIPVTYFIDAEGYLVTWGRGALSAEYLQQGVDMLLDGQ